MSKTMTLPEVIGHCRTELSARRAWLAEHKQEGSLCFCLRPWEPGRPCEIHTQVSLQIAHWEAKLAEHECSLAAKLAEQERLEAAMRAPTKAHHELLAAPDGVDDLLHRMILAQDATATRRSAPFTMAARQMRRAARAMHKALPFRIGRKR